MKRVHLAVAATLLLSTGGCATLPDLRSSKTDFIVIGDTPYDDVDRAMLSRALPLIKAQKPAFILHVGDIQSGGEVCGPPDDKFAQLLTELKPIPVIYTPGDNEWTDCDRKDDPTTGRKFSELQRLQTLRTRFFSAPALSHGRWRYTQQAEQPENARFEYKGLVFVTVHAVGTNNGRNFVMGDDPQAVAKAADARDAADVSWLHAAFTEARRRKARGVVVVMQADMTAVLTKAFGVPCTDAIADEHRLCDGHLPVRSALVEEARTFPGKVILIHGDTEPFTLSRGDVAGRSPEDTTPDLWRLNAAGDAGEKDGKSWGVRDVTAVTIDPSQPDPVSAHGLTTGKSPE
ncbi:MAG: metallophosphoesterase family protein [Asticcacaulis sp.]